MRTLVLSFGFWVLGWVVTGVAWCMLQVSGFAVEAMPRGFKVLWERRAEDISYSVWRTIPPGTNWVWLLNTTNTIYEHTNDVVAGTLFGVSAIVRGTNGYLVEDIGVVPWPPDRLKAPTNGVTLQMNATNNRLVHLTGSYDGASWFTLAVITNEQPAGLTATRKAMMLRASTNLPPVPR